MAKYKKWKGHIDLKLGSKGFFTTIFSRNEEKIKREFAKG